MLGTSASAPTKERGLSSAAIRYDGKIFLMDCGEGTQMQMLKLGLNIYRIEGIFLTHIHGDHVIGIAGIARTLSLYGKTSPLRIYIPKGYAKGISMLINFDNPIFKYKVEVIEVGSGKVYSDQKVQVSAFKLRHSVETYGYIFEEKKKPKFTIEAKRLGIRGKLFADIQKKGYLNINGKKIRMEDVSSTQNGRKIVYALDTRPSPSTIRAANDADLLIHEATYSKNEKKLAVERMHSTSEEAATVAKKAGVKRLILTHISTRYKEPEDNLKEARSVFKNCDIAKDGFKIVI